MVNREVEEIIKRALKEDGVSQDITTNAVFPLPREGKGLIIAKESGVLCGIEVANAVCRQQDKNMVFKAFKKDGQPLRKNERIAGLEGDIRSILSAERTALNFLSLLSGIATATAQLMAKVKGTPTKILDTRKTHPTLRTLEKYAVSCGGGHNHRYNLTDGIIIKDNHLRAAKFILQGKLNKTKVKRLLASIRKKSRLKIEVEVETLAEFKDALTCAPDIVMLDNFALSRLKAAVRWRNQHYPHVLLEASGGINAGNAGAVAQAGVEFISIGSLTHSPKAVDFSLEITE